MEEARLPRIRVARITGDETRKLLQNRWLVEAWETTRERPVEARENSVGEPLVDSETE